jgi:hypothetical protein
MIEASLPKAVQPGLSGHGGIESDRLGANRPWSAGGSDQPVSPLGFAARLKPNFRKLKEPQCQVVYRPRVADLELELNLADRLDGDAISAANLALVDSDLNSRGWERLDFDHFSRDRDCKDWVQVLSTLKRQEPPHTQSFGSTSAICQFTN